MNQLKNHNNILMKAFESFLENVDLEKFGEMVDLDSIDDVLRECLSAEEMKEAGSYFTGQTLATQTVNAFKKPITLDSVILDPTCGAGNLLIECSRKLGIKEKLSDTLKVWGRVLTGYDLHQSFVEAAKLRIVLEALNRGVIKDCSLEQALSYLSEIKVANAMTKSSQDLVNVTHAVMNPPFTNWCSPKTNYWKNGKVNAAGVVFDHFLRKLPINCEVSAILPDVLRSGSRYENWRNFVASRLTATCNIYGRFNTKTNVDVFILSGNIELNNNSIYWFPLVDNVRLLQDEYDVCIGPLVAYRDPEEGISYPYIHTKNATPWETLKEFSEFRKFKGRVIKSPFVVVRRTSSPSEKNRVTGTIISGKNYMAVENHMIVIKPKSGTVRDCKKLIRVLKSRETNDYINERIRCRHLTVGVIKSIPLL